MAEEKKPEKKRDWYGKDKGKAKKPKAGGEAGGEESVHGRHAREYEEMKGRHDAEHAEMSKRHVEEVKGVNARMGA